MIKFDDNVKEFRGNDEDEDYDKKVKNAAEYDDMLGRTVRFTGGCASAGAGGRGGRGRGGGGVNNDVGTSR